MQIFKKKEALKVGWELAIKNLGFVLIVVVIYFGLNMGLSGLLLTVEKLAGVGLLYFNVYIAVTLFTMLIMIGMLKIYFELYEGKKAEISTLFTSYEPYLDYLLCSILLMLIILGGFLLLIVPGIIWALKYQFAIYLVIDRKMKPVEAIKLSGKITHGHKVNLFLFYWVLVGVSLLGFFCCCIGLIPAMIIIAFAHIHVYRVLLSDYEKGPTQNTGASAGSVPPSVTAPACEVKSEQSTGNPISETKPVEEPQSPVADS